jgi:hypothetical protein
MAESSLAARYGLPGEIVEFLNSGFLQVLSERLTEKTVEFHIPSKRIAYSLHYIAAYSVVWIHPDFNVRFCHFYDETQEYSNLSCHNTGTLSL